MVLASMDLWDIVDEYEKAPLFNVNPKVLKEYQRYIMKAMSIIGLNLVDNQLTHINILSNSLFVCCKFFTCTSRRLCPKESQPKSAAVFLTSMSIVAKQLQICFFNVSTECQESVACITRPINVKNAVEKWIRKICSRWTTADQAFACGFLGHILPLVLQDARGQRLVGPR